jgi:hypothetical protein
MFTGVLSIHSRLRRGLAAAANRRKIMPGRFKAMLSIDTPCFKNPDGKKCEGLDICIEMICMVGR